MSLGSNPSVAKKKILSQVQSEQYHHQSLCTRVKYLKLSELKTKSQCGTVVECRTRDPEGPCSNPGVAKKKIFTGPIRTIPPTNPSAPELNTWNCQRWKPEVPCGTVVECRTRDPEVPGFKPQCGQKEISHRSNQNNTTTNPSPPELNTWNCQRWKPEVTCGTVVECRTRDLEVLGSNPSVAKKKISHRSNQNNTTTNPSAPELNTWNCQSWKLESQCGHSGRVQD